MPGQVSKAVDPLDKEDGFERLMDQAGDVSRGTRTIF
jgi:hypothetical protein